MASYPPLFSDQGVIDLCTNAGYPVSVDGFYNAINDATGNTNGSIDDVWKLYITDVLGETFVGQHPAHYGLSFGDALGDSDAPILFPDLSNALVSAQPALSGRDTPHAFGNSYYGYAPAGADATFGGLTSTAVGAIMHLSFPGVAAGEIYTGRGLSLPQNAYIDSATLSLTFKYVGPSLTGLRIYGKKVQQTTLPVANLTTYDEAAYGWIADGYMTTAYASLVPVDSGTVTVDIKDVLLEMMASAEWDATDHTVQLIVVPQPEAAGQDLSGDYEITVDRQNAGPTYLATLDVDYYASAGNPETAAITRGFVVNYMPVSDADLAIADRLRFVVQNNAGGREDGIVVPDDYDSGYTATIRNTTRKTVAVVGTLAELDPAFWNVLPQARFFGRKYNNHSELALGSMLASTEYTDGWRFIPRNYDYLLAVAIEFESTDLLRSYWDVWNYGDGYIVDLTSSQSAIFLTATGSTSTVELDMQTGTRVQATETGITAGAGRTLRVMLFWDHVATAWSWKLVVESSAGAALVTRTGTGAVATTWNPTSMTAANIDRRWLVGFRLDGGARMFGHAIIEWRASAAGVWEDTADWMTKSWVRGIKSIDPRLMR
jgi:hypothetical protein